MNRWLYRVLLRALPRDRRERYGDQMAVVFADVARHSPGHGALLMAWTRELFGLLRFGLRERLSRGAAFVSTLMPARMRGTLPPLGRELRWAWRGFLGRGWRGVMVVALLAVALAANTVVFSAADSFLLHPSPYPQAERLVSIGRVTTFDRWSDYGGPDTVPTWRGFTDIFSAVFAYDREFSAFVPSGDQGPHAVAASQVEPGLLELLGARPIAGRLFTSADRPTITGKNRMGWNQFAPTISIISETLARQEFGGSSEAIGRTLRLNKYPTTIVGVLPAGFRFPTGAEQIWTPLDVSLLNPSVGVGFLEQLAPGVPFERASAAVHERDPIVHARRPPPFDKYAQEPAGLRRVGDTNDPRMRKIVWLLVGAAACLLLIACANIVNLELAAAIPRARTSAIAVALGASPGSLLTMALFEGAIGVVCSIALAAVLAWQGTSSLVALLPAAIGTTLANPIDIDARTLIFMLVVAGAAWLVTTVPVALVSVRANVIDTLRLETRSSAGSARSTRVRQLLTGAEVGLSVLLLVGALLSSRSYSALLAIPKGFNIAGVIEADVTQQPGATETAASLEERILRTLRDAPFVSYASAASGVPPGSGGAINGKLTIDEQLQSDRVTASGYGVDPNFFSAMALPIVEGRGFTLTDPLGAVVIDEGFAKRYWPNRSAIGSTINFGKASLGPGGPKYTVIGVAAHMRNSHDAPTGPSADAFPLYYRLSDYSPLTFVVRLTDETRLADFKALMKNVTPTSRVRVDFVRDSYAKAYANEMIAATIMRIFGILALVVAVTGIYSVMAYMVAGRTREIGLRMALGADGRAITSMVLSSSMKMVVIGAAAGIGAALVAARWGSSLLFGVSARDPWIYTGVAAVVIVTAIIATWRPALVAARIDPSTLLRD
jgi:putative ABC transport system permease protein